MVWGDWKLVLSEEEVRKSFARVKEDITQVKRSLNKQLFSIEGMGKTLGNVLPKDEFYAFVQRLGSKVEELENTFLIKPDKKAVEELVSELRSEILAVRKVAERREDLTNELMQVRSLKGKLLELEGIAVSKPEFSKELAKLKVDLSGLKLAATEASDVFSSLSSSVSGIKGELSGMSSDVSAFKSKSEEGDAKASSLSSSLSKLEKSLTALSSKVNSLSSSTVAKEEIAAFTDRIESSNQESLRGFSSLKRDMDRKVSDVDKKMSLIDSVEEKVSALGEKLSRAENSLAKSSESANKKFVDKHVYEDFISSAEEKLAALSARLSETSDAVSSLGESSGKKFVDRRAFEKSISELRSQLSETRQLLESSMHEVAIEDYVTKRSLKQQLSSVSESVSLALSSSLSAKISGVEERLEALKRELDLTMDNADKQFGKEMQKFAPSKELKKLREELESLASGVSGLVSSEDFNSRFEKLQDSSAAAAGDFRKEVKRQREMFEEKLKSLESYYRSSNDTLKAELESVRSQIKGLTKADAEAKSEIAKVSVSASKAAAKTANDILEEIETESGSRRKGKGLSPLAVSLIILAMLMLGSITYVVLKGPGAFQTAESTLPFFINTSATVNDSAQLQEEINETALVNLSKQPENASINESAIQPVISNITNASIEEAVPEANTTANATTTIAANVTSESAINLTAGNLTAVSPDQACKSKLECTKRTDDEYWFDCYFDVSLNDCRCFVGSAENCPGMEENATATGASSENQEGEKAKSPGVKYYAVAAFVILVVAFFAYRALFVPKESHAEKKEPKAEKSKGKPVKESDDEEDDGVIDLEDFFEKKKK